MQVANFVSMAKTEISKKVDEMQQQQQANKSRENVGESSTSQQDFQALSERPLLDDQDEEPIVISKSNRTK